MSRSEWYILVDEDIGRRVVDFLEQEGIRADYVPDVLFQGADDEDDVMPYARENDAVLVTANWRDFTRFEPDRHDGCLVEFGHDETPMEITKAILAAIEHYDDPEKLAGWDKMEYWLEQSRTTE